MKHCLIEPLEARLAPASLSISGANVTEGTGNGGTAVFTISLSAADLDPVTINYATVDATAQIADNDYLAVNGTVTFQPGETVRSVNVAITGDARDEVDETFLMRLSNPTNATLEVSEASATIIDDDPGLSIGDVTLVESDSGTKEAIFPVTLSSVSGQTVRVNFATESGTAVTDASGSDYQAASGQLVFAPGETTKEVRVLVSGDTTGERDETFFINLTAPENAAVADARGIATITNDDPSLAIDDVAVVEGSSGTKEAVFTVRLSAGPNSPVSVNFATRDGTATHQPAGGQPADYTMTIGTLEFPAGETSMEVRVPVFGDDVFEADETFFVDLTAPLGDVMLADSEGAGTITNDESAPAISINDVSVVEGDAGVKNAVFEVTRTAGATQDPVTIEYSTVDDSASAGEDYTATAGQITFAPGETSRIVAVPILGDVRGESNETFKLRLSNVSTGGIIARLDGIATILNDDRALGVTNPTLNEGNGSNGIATFTVTLSQADTQNSITVDYGTADGSATVADNDYTPLSGTLVFLPGETSKQVQVSVTGDLQDEPGQENFFLQLSNPSNSNLGTPRGIATISDDDNPPTLSVTDLTITEGDSGSKEAVFTVTLSAASRQNIRVDYSTADATAKVAENDYLSQAGQLEFAPGETSKEIRVPILGDTVGEEDEAFVVRLAEPVNGQLGKAAGTATITNDDASFRIANVTIQEGNSGTREAVFTVTLAGAPAFPVSVDFQTADGTATDQPNGLRSADYTASNGTLQFAVGQTTREIRVPVLGDTVFEADETFSVNLANPTAGVTLFDAQGTGTITNDEAPPSIGIADVSLVEGDAGTTDAVFTVTLSGLATETQDSVTVRYETGRTSDTATDGVDYDAVSGALTFAPGESTKTISVPVRGDLIAETNETFTVRLFDQSAGALIANGEAVGTIRNDDPALTIADVTVVEGTGGTREAVFTVTLAPGAATTFPVTVAYNTEDGTAKVGDGDYTATSGTLMFAEGEAVRTIVVPLGTDARFEQNETFNVVLTEAVNAGIVDGSAIGTITNDDAKPVLSVGDATVLEGDSGTSTLRFLVTLTGETSEEVKVNLSTKDGTALTLDNDYLARLNQVLTFAPGETQKTFDVTVAGDTRGEADETVLVDLAPEGTNATIGTARGSGTIENDDPALSISDVQILEGNSGVSLAVFTVTLDSGDPQSTVTVDYSSSNASASAGTDYDAVNGTLTFAPGETEKTISVPVRGDTLAEADETFLVTLSNAQNAAFAKAVGTGTVQNDETQLRINDVRITEGNAGTNVAVFTVTRAGATSSTATVNFATVDGTATGSDYVSSSGTLSFASGEAAKTISVPVTGDLRGEIDEIFFVNLSDAMNALISDGQGQATIANDDTPTVQIDDAALFEGANGEGKKAIFTVRLSAESDLPVTVNYQTGEGTATSGIDYLSASGSVTFAPGTTSQVVEVTLIGDSLDEVDETFQMDLAGATNATIADAQGVGRILNDDLSLAIDDLQLVEGNTGSQDAVFTVTLSQASAHSVTVAFATQDGTATLADGDFMAANGTLTFAAGETTKTIRVPVNGDLRDEGDQMFSVLLSAVENAGIDDATGVATITNDDQTRLSIDDLTITEGDSGTTNALFRVKLSNPSTQAVTVTYTTQDGTATVADSDYAAASGSVTFAAGETEKTIQVSVTGDTKAEAEETFFVNLSGATNAILADDEAVGTIRDARVLMINDIRLAEGNAGTSRFIFTVSLDAPAEQPVSVKFRTQDGTASAAEGDYQSTTGTVTFAVGQRTAEIEVLVTGDVQGELDQTFFVALSEAAGASIGDDLGRATIANDETVFRIVSATDPGSNVVTLTEGDPSVAGATNATFKVIRTDASLAATVKFATALDSGDAAAEASDLSSVSGTLSFQPGEFEKELTVPITRDKNFEGSQEPQRFETFSVKLSEPANAVIGEGQDVGSVRIIDDDSAPFLTIGDVRIEEGNTGTKEAVFRVTLAAANEVATVTVAFATQDGTASSNGNSADFVAQSGSLTFLPSETSKEIRVLINGDLRDELTEETFTVELSSATFASIERAVATGTIADNEPLPALRFGSATGGGTGDVTIVEGDVGTANAVFTVRLSAASDREVVVDYVTDDQTATGAGGNTDYIPASGRLTFAPGELEKTVTVPVHGDIIHETNETFAVRLSGAVNAALGDELAVGTITNDDAAPALAINTVAIEEGNSGSKVATFTVTLAGVSQEVVTVTFGTADGTARDGVSDGRTLADYTASSGTLTFAPGETSKSISVPITGDLFKESDETFLVNLSAPQNATITGSQGTGTILQDNDTAVGILINDVSIVEGNGGGRQAIFRVELTGASDANTTFESATRNGTARGGSADASNRPIGGADFTEGRSNLTIPAGQTSAEIRINVFGDTDFEAGATESFFIDLENISSNVLPVDTEGRGFIFNDDSLLAPNGRSLKYIDVDGDLATIKVSKGALSLSLFTFRDAGSVGGKELQVIDFLGQTQFQGANLAVTAEPQPGFPGSSDGTPSDGRVNVGYLRAGMVRAEDLSFVSGIDLASVRIEGDLGKFTVGDNLATAALGKLDVLSFGTANIALPAGLDGFDDVTSGALAAIRSLVVRGDFAANLSVLGDQFGRINNLRIDGALREGSVEGTGQIQFGGRLGKAVLGSIIGGNGDGSGLLNGSANKASIGSVKILGELRGGSGQDSGTVLGKKIGNVSVGSITGGTGDFSGLVRSTSSLGNVTVAGDVIGGAGASAFNDTVVITGSILSETKMGRVEIGGDLQGGTRANGAAVLSGRIASVTVDGSIIGGDGDVSGKISATTKIGFVQIGSESAAAGSVGDLRGGAGENSGAIEAGSLQRLRLSGSILGGARDSSGGVFIEDGIRQIEIGGDIRGGDTPSGTSVSSSGYVLAGAIGSMKLSGDLIAGTNNGTGLANSGAIRAGEIGSLTIAGSVTGNSATPAIISAEGTGKFAIKSLAVAGSVSFADILAGYGRAANSTVPRGEALNADAQIGSVSIGGEVEGLNLVAGALAGADLRFGTDDDSLISGESVTDKRDVLARIASVIIRGTVAPTEGVFGIVAQEIQSINAGAAAEIRLPASPDRHTQEIVPGTHFRAVQLPEPA